MGRWEAFSTADQNAATSVSGNLATTRPWTAVRLNSPSVTGCRLRQEQIVELLAADRSHGASAPCCQSRHAMPVGKRTELGSSASSSPQWSRANPGPHLRLCPHIQAWLLEAIAASLSLTDSR